MGRIEKHDPISHICLIEETGVLVLWIPRRVQCVLPHHPGPITDHLDSLVSNRLNPQIDIKSQGHMETRMGTTRFL